MCNFLGVCREGHGYVEVLPVPFPTLSISGIHEPPQILCRNPAVVCCSHGYILPQWLNNIFSAVLIRCDGFIVCCHDAMLQKSLHHKFIVYFIWSHCLTYILIFFVPGNPIVNTTRLTSINLYAAASISTCVTKPDGTKTVSTTQDGMTFTWSLFVWSRGSLIPDPQGDSALYPPFFHSIVDIFHRQSALISHRVGPQIFCNSYCWYLCWLFLSGIDDCFFATFYFS